jgi:hypothetical protein
MLLMAIGSNIFHDMTMKFVEQTEKDKYIWNSDSQLNE